MKNTKENMKNIEDYIKSLPLKPDNNVTPKVIIKWDRSHKLAEFRLTTPVFYYPKEGKIEFLDTLPENYSKYRKALLFTKDRTTCNSNFKISVVSAKNTIRSYYAKWHKQIDALEIAIVKMAANRGKEGEIREWEYENIEQERYFLFKNGDAFRNYSYLPKDGRYYNKLLAHWLEVEIPTTIHNEYFDKETTLFLERAFDGGNQLVTNYYWTPFRVAMWYKTVITRPVKKNSIKPFILESVDLIEYPLQILNREFRRDSSGAICIPYKNGVLVRGYKDYKCKYIDYREYKETYRFFFSEKEIFILKYWAGKWINCSVNNCYFFCDPNSISGFNKLRKIYPYACEDVLKYRRDYRIFIHLYNTIKNPIIEKLDKAGYDTLGSFLSESPSSRLKTYFSVTSGKKGSIYQNLGLNKTQIILMETYLRDHKTLPRVDFLKQIGGNDIVHWDEKRSLKFFEFASSSRNTLNGYLFRFNHLGLPYCVNDYHLTDLSVTEEENKNIEKIINLAAKTPEIDVLRLFKDTVYAMCWLAEEFIPTMNPYNAKSFRDLSFMHDQYVEIGNAKEAKRTLNLEKWNKLNEKRIELFEREDDNFKIIVPRNPEDVSREGALLNHCVGGYINSIASGSKTILFLRRKEEPDKPFYTIEVNDSIVIQIHGLKNKWLGNNSEAIQFVINWLKEVKIYCSAKILFNLGQGYVGSSQNLNSSGFELNEFVKF